MTWTELLPWACLGSFTILAAGAVLLRWHYRLPDHVLTYSRLAAAAVVAALVALIVGSWAVIATAALAALIALGVLS
jgi:hypothetical protein